MGRITLTDMVSITVPSTMGLNEPIDNTEYVNSVAMQLAKLFGGCDLVKGDGFYNADDGSMIVEYHVKVIARCEPLTDEQILQVIDIALDLKAKMKQEAIFYEINNIAYLE